MNLIVIFVALILLYTLVSKRLDRTILTAPILFTGAGMLVLLVLPGLQEQQVNIEVFMKVAEVGLVLLLFTDARFSLTVVRMLPVAIALWGTRLSSATVLFMGWFGPRGLASIVLGLVYIEHSMHEGGAAHHQDGRHGDRVFEHFCAWA